MNIFSLECFVSLAETMNFTETANRLYINQSALSRTISRMEDALGAKLLDRTSHSVSLTAAGRCFLADSKKIVDYYYASVARAKTAYHGLNGSIIFGCHFINFEPITADIIIAFKESYPDISLEIRGHNTSELLRNFDKQSVDVAVTTGLPHLETAERILLTSNRECAVMLPGHKFADRTSLSMGELRGECFVIMSQNASSRGHDSVIGKSRNAGFSPNVIEQASSVPHLLSLICAYNCVTILSENYKKMTDGRLVFVPLSDVPSADMVFIWNKESANPCVKWLAAFVDEKFGKP